MEYFLLDTLQLNDKMEPNKKQLRQDIKALKKEQDKTSWDEKSNAIFSAIEHMDVFKNATSILCYWSLPDEVQTHSSVTTWAKSKKVFLPVVKGDDLDLVLFEGIEKMEAEPVFGILEPKSSIKASVNDIDIIIVPGVAFDKSCNRMGRGKGYYDRLLSASRATKVGVGFDFQLVEQVPTEPHDVQLDLIVTETNIYHR